MKTEIFFFVYNRTDLLPKQIECYRKFFKGEYNLNVVCDYREEQFYDIMRSPYVDEFEEICKREGVNFYKHESQHGLGPSHYHGNCVTWAYKNIKKGQEGYALIVDNDMFLVDDFNMDEYMADVDIAGRFQERGDVKYFWPGMIMLNLKAVEKYDFHFAPDTIRGEMLDSGGGTYVLLENLKYKDTGVEYPEDFNGIDLTAVDEGYGFELHGDMKFFHARNSCGWHRGYQVIEGSEKTKTIDTVLGVFLNG